MKIAVLDDLLKDIIVAHNELISLVVKNNDNEFFNSIQSSLKGLKIVNGKEMSSYLWKILYPIDYKRNIEPNGFGKCGVGKWFGKVKNSNIVYFSEESTLSLLSEKHIDLTPKKVQPIIREFYDFYMTNMKLLVSTDSYAVSLPVLSHGFTRITALQSSLLMNTCQRSKSYFAVGTETSSIISTIKVMFQSKPFKILIFLIKENPSNPFFLNEETYGIDSEGVKSDLYAQLMSNPSLYNLHGFNSKSYSGFGLLDDPSKFITTEVKEFINIRLAKILDINRQWEEMKSKYAYLLLEKGLF